MNSLLWPEYLTYIRYIHSIGKKNRRLQTPIAILHIMHTFLWAVL